MTKYEEIYLIAGLIAKADQDGQVNFGDPGFWSSLLLTDATAVSEDYFLELAEKHVLDYDEIGDEGSAPIVMCFITPQTTDYLRKLIHDLESDRKNASEEISALQTRIREILTFDPQKLSKEINATASTIAQTRLQLQANPVLAPLLPQLNQIETHFESLSMVANHYENVYKNIVLPVKEEGRSGIRQTVKWAIISIIVSTILSAVISWLMK